MERGGARSGDPPRATRESDGAYATAPARPRVSRLSILFDRRELIKRAKTEANVNEIVRLYVPN